MTVTKMTVSDSCLMLKKTKIFLLQGLIIISSSASCLQARTSRLERIGQVATVANQVFAAALSGFMLVYVSKVMYDKYQQKNMMNQKPTVTTKFHDVAGAAQAKEALIDIVEYLKHPDKYSKLGARISKGVLLTGTPGNGKTLLARALAGESGCAFYHLNATELISKYWGEGPERVRDLFARARKNAPSIIFIDEIDAIGGDRTAREMGWINTEVLNQLLSCMDGFSQPDKPVIVIATTNYQAGLDPALIRPGRFDQIINVPNPDLKSRVEVLNIYLKKITVCSDLDVTKIARGTIGFSGADLANLVNEAAVIATKNGAAMVSMTDFEEARDRVIMGAKSKTIMVSEQDRAITAYHEAGHALVNLMLPANLLDPLHKITITPRGNSLGAAYYLPENDKYTSNKSVMLARITMTCGGRAAEQLVFSEVTTGPVDDFNKATSIARSMVCDYGMSEEIGMAVYKQQYGVLNCSPAVAEKIDLAVNKIIETCYLRAKQILIDHRDKLDLLAQALLEKETLDASEVYALLGVEARADLRLNRL